MPDNGVRDADDAQGHHHTDCKVVDHHSRGGAYRWVEAVRYFGLGQRPFFPRVLDHQRLVYNGGGWRGVSEEWGL